MGRLIRILLFILLLPLSLRAQQVSFVVDQEIVWAGIDRPGDLFLLLNSGTLVKYDRKGVRLATLPNATRPVLIDPMDGTQCFLLKADRKSYTWLSPELDVRKELEINPAFAVQPWMICPSLHEFWIADGADLTLKKTKLKATTVALEVALPSYAGARAEEILSMREYQNYLFIHNRVKGIEMFNSVGKYIRTIGEGGIPSFNFLGEELYYISQSNLVFVDLYTQEIRNIPLPHACLFALIGEDYIYAVEKDQVTILPFKAN